MSQESKLLCKDCVHSFIPLADRVVTIVFNLGIANQYQYMCKKSFKEELLEYNPVTGHKKAKAHYQRCSAYRISSNDCGTEGKYWSPKHKKHLFLAITRSEV